MVKASRIIVDADSIHKNSLFLFTFFFSTRDPSYLLF